MASFPGRIIGENCSLTGKIFKLTCNSSGVLTRYCSREYNCQRQLRRGRERRLIYRRHYNSRNYLTRAFWRAMVVGVGAGTVQVASAEIDGKFIRRFNCRRRRRVDRAINFKRNPRDIDSRNRIRNSADFNPIFTTAGPFINVSKLRAHYNFPSDTIAIFFSNIFFQIAIWRILLQLRLSW